MLEGILNLQSFWTFILLSTMLAIVPGPGVLYVVTRTLSQGRRAGFASIGGIALGNLGNSVASSIGLAAILAASGAAFQAVKLLGAIYLVLLGIKSLRAKEKVSSQEIDSAKQNSVDGFWVALLNPKTALFFAAFLPQFISTNGSPILQSVFLGCIFVVIAMCTDAVYVLTASAVVPSISKKPYCRYLSAITFIGLGIYTAITNPRVSK